MGNKKLWLAIVLLFVAGALFGQMVDIRYVDNYTEQEYSFLANKFEEQSMISRTEKLPNTIIQAIDYALNDYSLEVGDIFLAGYNYYATVYIVFLRITDSKNKGWQYYAWTR